MSTHARRPNCRAARALRLAVVSACVLAAAFAAGCRTVEAHAAGDLSIAHAPPTALVLPLYENPDEYGASDYTLFGSTGSQGSGLVVSRAVASSVKTYLRVVPPEELRLAMIRRGLKVPELTALPDAEAVALARDLQADALILGQVETCRTSWFLFIPRSRVAFTLRALRVTDGQPWWHARFEEGSFLATERELAADGARRVISLLAAKRNWPPQSSLP